ncbi:hypothetical protein ACH5BF_02100 [Arcobacter sp. YIC-464]|uniref:hypothetical protein n=1 Tax=Arcobacter sp. YIC-464 TaxID=3376631 RepID=UPI003C17BD77
MSKTKLRIKNKYRKSFRTDSIKIHSYFHNHLDGNLFPLLIPDSVIEILIIHGLKQMFNKFTKDIS